MKMEGDRVGGGVGLRSIFLLCSCVVKQHEITSAVPCSDSFSKEEGKKEEKMYLSFP